MIRDRLAEIKTTVTGDAIIDEGNFVYIRCQMGGIGGSINMPLRFLPWALQERVKKGEKVMITATFESSPE